MWYVSPDIIEVWEALVTICLYIPLLSINYGYDKLREMRLKRRLMAVDQMD